MTDDNFEDPRQEIEELRLRLEEAEQTLQAIRAGEVDSLVVDGPDGPRVYALEGASNSYRVLVEAMSEGAATLTEEGAILYCNSRFALMLGAPLHQVMGASVHDFLPDSSRSTFDALLHRASEGESKGELELRTSAGGELPAYLSVSALHDGGRRVLCLVATDLREQKRNEEIVASERLARSVLEQTVEAIVVCDEQGQIIRANVAAEQLCGENPLLRSFGEAFPLELAPLPGQANQREDSSANVVEEALTGTILRAVPASLRHPDGSRAHLLVSATALRDATGQGLGCVINVLDITRRKQAEEAIREAERARQQERELAAERLAVESERLRTTLHSIGDAVIVTNDTGEITMLNPTAGALTGWGNEALGRPLEEIFCIVNEETRQTVESPVTKVLREGGVAGLANHTVLITRDGRELPIDDSGAPIRGRNGRIDGVVLVFRDVTERRKTENERADRATEIAESDRLKSEFLATLSHELRNPLAPIRNSLYLLDRAPPGSAQASRAKAVIERQTQHLARLVDDLIDQTRISRGKVELNRTTFDVREVLRRACDDHRPLFDTRSIELRVEMISGPVWIEADETRITQVTGNLLQNALKFGHEEGSVTVTARKVDGRAEISVRDDGIGIAPELLPRVFDPFVQGYGGLARAKGGLGLGLALVKGLVELHGGSVHASSDGPGRGAEFVVTLPLAPAPAHAAAHIPAATARSVEILVIEDNVDQAHSIAEVLEMEGHRVHVATDGLTGVAKARELRPEVVLCDIGLPDVDGYEVARVLRADDGLRSMRLIALSGYAQPEDRRLATEAGFDDHISKPPSLRALLALVAGKGGRAG